MRRQINFTLKQDELLAVEEAMHHAPQAEVRQRATAIRMLHLGHKPETVAELLAVAPNTVWNRDRRYRADGLARLANEPKSGRPAKVVATYVQAVATTLEADPRELGYSFSVWTINCVRTWPIPTSKWFDRVCPEVTSKENKNELGSKAG